MPFETYKYWYWLNTYYVFLVTSPANNTTYPMSSSVILIIFMFYFSCLRALSTTAKAQMYYTSEIKHSASSLKGMFGSTRSTTLTTLARYLQNYSLNWSDYSKGKIITILNACVYNIFYCFIYFVCHNYESYGPWNYNQ